MAGEQSGGDMVIFQWTSVKSVVSIWKSWFCAVDVKLPSQALKALKATSQLPQPSDV